jgi:hypothetical protein
MAINGGIYLKNKVSVSKKYGPISYISLIIGITCFIIVFVKPIYGSVIGNYIMFILTGVGILLSFIGLFKRTEKSIIPFISLILSCSLFILWILIYLAITGRLDFYLNDYR